MLNLEAVAEKSPGGAPLPPSARPAPPGRSRLWTWITAGAAVTTGIVGVALGASVLSDHDEYKETQDYDRYKELEGSIPGKVTVTNVMYVTAGVLAVSAVVLYFLEGRSLEKARIPDNRSTLLSPRLLLQSGKSKGALLELSF